MKRTRSKAKGIPAATILAGGLHDHRERLRNRECDHSVTQGTRCSLCGLELKDD